MPPKPVQVVQSYWQVAGGAYAEGSTPRPRQANRVILVLTARGKLVGLSRDSGELIWWNQLTHQDHGITDLAITEDTIFATTSTQMLFCIDYRTGATRWTAPTTSARAKILVDGSYVFVVHSDDVNCFNIHGYRLWSQKLPGMGMARLGIGMPGNVRLSDPPI